jgi:hypothetical protein
MTIHTQVLAVLTDHPVLARVLTDRALRALATAVVRVVEPAVALDAQLRAELAATTGTGWTGPLPQTPAPPAWRQAPAGRATVHRPPSTVTARRQP